MEPQLPITDSPPPKGKATSAYGAIQSVKSESILNGPLWALGLISASVCVTAPFASEIAEKLFWLDAAILVFTGAVFVYFMIKDPNRLQSENFQLEVRKIELMLDEKNDDPQIIDMKPSSNTHITKQGQ